MELDLKNGNINSLLYKMAAPTIMGMLVNGLYYLVDAAFVGWGVGSDALAGLGVIFPLQMFAIAWGSMIGTGTASIISRRLGENDRPAAGTAATQATGLALVSGILLTILAVILHRPLLQGLGATAGVFSAASEYFGTIRYGFVFVFLSMIGFNIARAQGMAGAAGRGMILGTIANVILDPVCIFLLHMGVQGAALATVVARALSTLYFLVLLNRKGTPVPMNPKGVKTYPALIRNILVLGMGTFLGQISFSVIAVIVNRSLRMYGTDIDLAVYGILSRIHVFVTMPILGLVQGFQPIAGFNYGNGNIQRVRRVLGSTVATTLIVGAIMLVFPLLLPEQVLGLFCDDPLLIQAGIVPLRTTMMLLPIIGLQIVGFSLYQAVGYPAGTLIISLSRHFMFLAPLLFILPELFDTRGLWAAFPTADALAGILSVTAMLRLLNGPLRPMPPALEKSGR